MIQYQNRCSSDPAFSQSKEDQSGRNRAPRSLRVTSNSIYNGQESRPGVKVSGKGSSKGLGEGTQKVPPLSLLLLQLLPASFSHTLACSTPQKMSEIG